MKKSLLVAPALGVLLLAAAGSVGGTVAWFTSASSVNTEISTFQAQALDGNLELVMAAGEGTVLSNDKIAVNENYRMTHASYDHLTKKLFTRSSEYKGGVRELTGDHKELAKASFDGVTGHDMYYAVTWTMTFSYTWATENAVNLYFDPSSVVDLATEIPEFSAEASYTEGKKVKKDGSVYVAKEAVSAGAWDGTKWTEIGNKDTTNGFRIAFVGEQYSNGVSVTDEDCTANVRVWANKRSASDATAANQPHFVSSAAVTALESNDDSYWKTGTEYISPALIDSTLVASAKEARPEGQAVTTNQTAAVDCLGQFVRGSEATTDIKFTCVAWFEGTDPDVVNASLMDPIKASMKFYAREYKA